MEDELEAARELEESSNEVADDADEELLKSWRSCRSGALYARTFVVERSSIGREILLRSKLRSNFLVLVARPGV